MACLWMPPEWDPVQGRMRVPIEVEDPTPQRRLWPTRGRRLASATLLLGGLIAMVAIAVGPPEELRWVMGLGGLACLGLAGALQDGRYRFLGGVRSLRPSLPSRPGARGADGPTATR